MLYVFFNKMEKMKKIQIFLYCIWKIMYTKIDDLIKTWIKNYFSKK